MEAKKLIFWLGGGLLAYTAYQKYMLYNGLQFTFAGVNFSGSITNPVLNVKISLNNPTKNKATLQKITGYLFDGQQPISQVVYDTVQVIAPYNRTVITLKFYPDLPGVLQSAAKYYKTKKIKFNFQGTATIDNVPVPVNIDYDLR